MSEFTFLFRGRDTSASPEQMQKTMEKWMAWFKDLGANGHIKYPGHPLQATGKVVEGKQKIVHDGPYAEPKDVVNGFTLIEARDRFIVAFTWLWDYVTFQRGARLITEVPPARRN